MKKRQVGYLGGVLIAVLLFAGCGNKSKDETKTQSSVSSSESVSSTTSSQSSVVKSTVTTTSETSLTSYETPTSTSASETVPSEANAASVAGFTAEQAFAMLPESSNSDIAYGVVKAYDDSYVLSLTSQSMRAQGGSGTVGLYRVFADGTYYLVVYQNGDYVKAPNTH